MKSLAGSGEGGAFRGRRHLNDAEFARRVRSDAIDVLVDLSGHTAGNRLVAFAGRCATVQATWLGT